MSLLTFPDRVVYIEGSNVFFCLESFISLVKQYINQRAMLTLSPYSTEKQDPTRMKLTPKIVKCTWPTPEFCVGYLYSTGLRLDFAPGKMQFLGFALGKTQKMCVIQRKTYRHVGIFCVR